jgi:hypothetical protein
MHNAAQDKSCDKRDYSRHQMLVFDVREDVISLGPRVGAGHSGVAQASHHQAGE